MQHYYGHVYSKETETYLEAEANDVSSKSQSHNCSGHVALHQRQKLFSHCSKSFVFWSPLELWPGCDGNLKAASLKET